MFSPRTPEESSPEPSGPDESSPRSGSCRSAIFTASLMFSTYHAISAAPPPSGVANWAALAAYAAAPRACAPLCATPDAWPAAQAAALPAGEVAALAARPATKAATNIACRVQLSAGESSGALDSNPCSLVVWRLLLEQGQNAFSAIRGPSGDDPAVVLAQCLWGEHASPLRLVSESDRLSGQRVSGTEGVVSKSCVPRGAGSSARARYQRGDHQQLLHRSRRAALRSWPGRRETCHRAAAGTLISCVPGQQQGGISVLADRGR
jgi:hypothetical protein